MYFFIIDLIGCPFLVFKLLDWVVIIVLYDLFCNFTLFFFPSPTVVIVLNLAIHCNVHVRELHLNLLSPTAYSLSLLTFACTVFLQAQEGIWSRRKQGYLGWYLKIMVVMQALKEITSGSTSQLGVLQVVLSRVPN